MGVIDTLSAGFSLINRRLWLIAIPVIIDVFLWIGPGLNMAPVAHRLPDALYNTLAQLAEQGGSSQVSAEDLGQYRTEIRQYTDELGKTNLFGLLALQTPGLLSRIDGPRSLALAADLSLDRWAVLLPATLGLLLTSLLLASLFMTGLGTYVRGDLFQLRRYLRRSVVNWGRLMLFYVLVIAAALVLGTPIIGIGMLLAALFEPLGILLIGVFVAVALWAAFYLFYSFAAIFVGDVNPLRALWHSFNVVRFNLGPALWLALLVVIIGEGTAMAWRLVFGSPFLVSVAIIGNAYIGAGLTCAGMIFYRERYNIWQRKLLAGKQVVEMKN